MVQLRGSITVFLTLVMVCIISLVGTMLDLARFEMADHMAYDTLVTAVDAKLTNYCREIYDDYKIFLLKGDKKEEVMNGEEYIESIKEYLTYSFEPKREIGINDISFSLPTRDLLAIELKECTLKGQTMITDHEGEIFQYQVEEYMKYHVPAELAESLLSKLNLLQNTGTTISVFRKKMEVEEQAAEISQSILDLIRLVEGLTFEDGELEMTRDEFIVIQSSFAKQFCTEKVSPKAVAIDHNLVWDSLRDKYTNPVTMLSEIKEYNEELLTLEKEKEELTNTLKEETDAEKRQQYEGELEQKKGRIQELKDKIDTSGASLVKKAKGIQEKMREAIDIIDGLKGKKESCVNKLTAFESYLNTKKDKLDEGSYNAVSEETSELKDYLFKVDASGVDTSIVGNVTAMKDCLKSNLMAIEKTVNLEPLFQQELDPDYAKRKSQIEEAMKTYSTYTLRPLKFDYTRLNTEPKEKSPVEQLSDVVGSGICSLILKDGTSLSKEKLSNTILPSKTGNIKETEETKATDKDPNSNLAGEISEGQDGDMTSSMEEYETICNKAKTEGSAVNDIARRVLLNSYGMSYFKNYTTSAKVNEESEESQRLKQVLKKDSVLAYEQEYLIMGGETDEENVKDIINRTVFIRTTLNYLSLLTNSMARGKAEATATAMVGFTGCAPLVTIIKHVILMGWGFEEALVDVGALMQGKKVPLFKKAGNFSIQYHELVTISRTLIQSKIKKLPQEDKGMLSMTYKDYLNFYMYMIGPDTLSYRMMDLIQENTRLRYDKDFLMQNGVYGMEVSLEYEVPDRFLSLPLIKSFVGRTGGTSTVEISTEYSY